MQTNNPLISVITVSYNSVKTIENTILSVFNQTYKNIEYIIIDGGSTDGTKDIIEKYRKTYPMIFIYEKDNGIYDAMNKGVRLATGKYVNFMNSDDYFFENNVISDIIPLLDGRYDIIYGNVEVRHDNFKYIKKNLSPQYLWMGPVNHQSSFIKREAMEKYKYYIKNKITADYEFFLTIYYNNGKILKIPKTIASFYSGGISGENEIKVINDCYDTIKKFNRNIFIFIYYKILKIKPILKKIFFYFIKFFQ